MTETLQPTKRIYLPQIDFIKGLAIILVITLHSLLQYNPSILTVALAELHLWQAVPIFCILIGITINIHNIHVQKQTKLTQLYSRKYLYSKLKRFLIPTIIAFLISLAYGAYIARYYLGELTLLGFMPVPGPGNYFITILLQVILLTPLIIYAYRRRPNLTIAAMILIDLAFQFTAPTLTIFKNNSYLYHASILRYFSAIALGLYISKQLIYEKKIQLNLKQKLVLKTLACGSIAYIILTTYYEFQLPLFNSIWGAQNALSFFYPLAIVTLILNAPVLTTKWYDAITKIGKASYHIFLVQMLFFGFNLSLTSSTQNNLAITNLITVAIATLGNLTIILTISWLFYKIRKK